MMKAVLKTLAISFGGGLALGAGIRLTQGPSKSPPEPRVDLDPLLTRLKNVEGRIVQMETSAPVVRAAAPAPSGVPEKTLAAFESKLAAQLADVNQLRGEIRRVDQRLGDLDTQLPVIIQSTVDVRFQEVERKLQHDFEEAQNRSMAAFVDTLQTKVVERISTLETNLAQQSSAIGKLRDASLRTDENLQKMLVGIEKLVDQTKVLQPEPSISPPPAAPQPPPKPEPAMTVAEPARTPEPPRKLEPEPALISDEDEYVSEEYIKTQIPQIPVLAHMPDIPHPGASAPVQTNGAVSQVVPATVSSATQETGSSAPAEKSQPTEPLKSEESFEWVNRIGLELLAPRPKPRIGWRIPLTVGLVAGLILIAGLLYSGVLQRYFDSSIPQQNSALASTAPTTEAPPVSNDVQALEQRAAAKPGDAASFVELAREYQRRKDWPKAEAAYRSALGASPGNREAALGLSDVLYQEQKYEESAAVLNKLSSSKSQ
jgi:uncharacterized coiled-coil protein SlyX